jgi:hypothetical protein
MPKIEPDDLTAGQQWRLRIALDRVMPPFSPPRYLVHRQTRISAWRLAPASLALAMTGVLALSAYAATGSANPAVWGQRAASTIESVRLAPAVVPAGPSAPAQPAAAPRAAASPSQGTHDGHSKPEPSDHHSGSGQPGGTPTASGSRHSPSPSPSSSPSPQWGGDN